MLITHAVPDQMDVVRELFLEYADGLGVDLSFQKFDEELSGLPGEYSGVHGRLLLAFADDRPIGCIALRRIDGTTCEMKRLYVRPDARAGGVGLALIERVLAEARDIGYRRIRLDTLPSMQRAKELYRRLGFVEIEAYRHNPVAGSLFMELVL